MLASVASALQAANTGLLLVGGLCCIGVIIWLARRGRWRDPLAGVPLPVHGPPLAAVLFVALAYIALQFVAVQLLARDLPADTVPEPGSGVWYRLQMADGIAKALVSVLMVVILAQGRGAGAPRRMSWLTATWAGLLGLLVVLPIVTAQLEMGRVLWDWLHPGTPPPLHVVLAGLARNEWGAWGAVVLLIGAILIAPVAEELFFRGLILPGVAFYTRRAWPAILVASLAFGLVHAQPQDILPLVTMGIVLGYLRIRCGALWPCILLHMLFNTRTMLAAVLAPEMLTQS